MSGGGSGDQAWAAHYLSPAETDEYSRDLEDTPDAEMWGKLLQHRSGPGGYGAHMRQGQFNELNKAIVKARADKTRDQEPEPEAVSATPATSAPGGLSPLGARLAAGPSALGALGPQAPLPGGALRPAPVEDVSAGAASPTGANPAPSPDSPVSATSLLNRILGQLYGPGAAESFRAPAAPTGGTGAASVVGDIAQPLSVPFYGYNPLTGAAPPYDPVTGAPPPLQFT